MLTQTLKTWRGIIKILFTEVPNNDGSTPLKPLSLEATLKSFTNGIGQRSHNKK